MSRRKRGSKRGGRKRGATVHIPTDSLEEILHRLPSNDLLKFKIVCKDWLHLISSPEFIQKHLQRSKAESRIVASQNLLELEILGYCANSLTSNKIRGKGHVRLLGSCDGLVLYMDTRVHKIGALNPSTIEVDERISKAYTENEIILQHILTCTWFGRHPATGEHVLVIAYVKLGEYKSIGFKVYDLSRNLLLSSLTEVLDRNEDTFNGHDIGTFLHGRLHVTVINVDSYSGKFDILAYDLQANRMLRMCVPLPYCPALGVVDGCLCALNRSEVWMMKEYGDKESWTKYANIDDNISIPLQIYPNDDVILRDDFLKAIREWATEFPYYTRFIRRGVVACIDSLVSPAMVWERKE